MDKIHLYDKILSPLVTEKSTNLSEQNKIVFKVPSQANKKNIKSNIEKILSKTSIELFLPSKLILSTFIIFSFSLVFSSLIQQLYVFH